MPYVFNPFTGTLDYYKTGIDNIGGLYGINIETLAANKTLTPNVDKVFQYLDEGGADRIITLATAGAIAGDFFVIRHNGDYTDTHYLRIEQAATVLDYIYAGGFKRFVFDGTNWVSNEIGTGENNDKRYNTGIGYYATSYSKGTAIGYLTKGQNSGVSVGVDSDGSSFGVAVGQQSRGDSYSIAIGFAAQGRNYNVALGRGAICDFYKFSVALGNYSRNVRSQEITNNIGGDSSQKNNTIIVGFIKSTANDTPVEMLCGGIAGQRCTVRASSALAFRITVTARDNVAGHVAMYTFEGLIKRDAANNTVLSIVNKTVIHEDDATWDANVTADDVNEALVITVTGDVTNPTQWVARLDGVETHF